MIQSTCSIYGIQRSYLFASFRRENDKAAVILIDEPTKRIRTLNTAQYIADICNREDVTGVRPPELIESDLKQEAEGKESFNTSDTGPQELIPYHTYDRDTQNALRHTVKMFFVRVASPLLFSCVVVSVCWSRRCGLGCSVCGDMAR